MGRDSMRRKAGNEMRVRNVGPNMTEIEVVDKRILISYETPVACGIMGEGWYRTSHKWSPTTTRHINKWLDGAEAEERPQSYFDNLLV